MNSDDKLEGIELIGVAFILLMVISGMVFPIIRLIDNKSIKLRAVEMERAYYDSKTGEFMWSDNVSKYIFTGEK